MHPFVRYVATNYKSIWYKIIGRPELRYVNWAALIRDTDIIRRIRYDVVVQNRCRQMVKAVPRADGLVSVLVGGIEVWYPTGADASVIGRSYYEIFEPHSGHFYDLHCTAPTSEDVVWDIGACEGLYGIKHVGSVKALHMFEPSRIMCGCLTKSFSQYAPDRYAVHNLLLSEVPDISVGFIENSADPTTSSFAKAGEDCSYTLRTKTIDKIVSSGEIAAPTLLKMDVQGAELSILKGARRVLGEYKPRMAITTYHNPTDATEIIEFVRSCQPAYRFTLKGITTVYPIPRPTMVHCW